MSGLHTHLVMQQGQTMAPRLQQQVRLLQLSSLEFMHEIRQMLDRNPFLEEMEPLAVDTAADEQEDRESWQADGHGSGTAARDGGDLDALAWIPARATLAEHLHLQLNVQSLGRRDLAAARAIVEFLDDDGQLRTPLDEIVPLTGLQPMASFAEMRIALRRVQSLDPAGVGARSLQECLLLQTREIDDPALRSLARDILDTHLQALASPRDMAALPAAMGRTAVDVARACTLIRRMDPHPGWRIGGEPADYITPDVVVRKVKGRWTASLNPVVQPRVKFNQPYADLFERHRRKDDGALADQLRDARWAVRTVQQRFATILDVARSIVRRQVAFFEFGDMALKPLSLRDVADEVGVHESTVSRVTNNKYLATLQGVFELKHFFSRAMTSSSGAAYSGKAVRELVSEMIREEPQGAPLTDAEIARRLATQGFVLCRRTVTKYRREMRIPAADRRTHGHALAGDA